MLGNLSVSLAGVASSTAYNRSLDFSTGIHTTTFVTNGSTYTSAVYCSYPDQVCVYEIESSSLLPEVVIGIENQMVDPTIQNVTCGEGFVRLTGLTQAGPPSGMRYDSIARLSSSTNASYCNNQPNLVVRAGSSGNSLTLVIGAGTNYDQTQGNAASNFSFMRADPGAYVENVTATAVAKEESDLRSAHVADYSSLTNTFSIELPDTAYVEGMETSALISEYSANGSGNPYLEKTLFDYGRHLFISSSRDNSLPPNLQGRWAIDLSNAWSGDYHANINLQMNHWGVDQTGLGDLQVALWNYMQNTWVPRGQITAQLLYGSSNSSGAWVTHDEMNIFGHTAMKYQAQWADYPASAAWMMEHVFSHWDYSQDNAWLASQGYPLLKGVAEFWIGQLQEDDFFNDGSLVVNPW